MAEKLSKSESLDDFWNIEQLTPKKKNREYSSNTKNYEPVEVIGDPINRTTDVNSSDFTIKRYIPPYQNGNISRGDDFEWELSYIPTHSLIHRVTVKKYKSSYNYYKGFAADAQRYRDMKGVSCEYVPFFSYVPQYDQMNDDQFKYYLWFRENARMYRQISSDQGYILLYIFELINLSVENASDNLKQLMFLFEEYGEKFPAIAVRLADWICDYGLVHKLMPPEHRSSIIKKLRVLKEYFIHLPADDIKQCAKTLFTYCCSYDYRTSKFYLPQNKELFDKYIMGAIEVAVRFYSTDGGLLSGAQTGDSTVSRDAFAGALCVSDVRYRIDIEYCSFSRSNELRFIIGDVVKYAENKIRAYIGIKSKMTVYSLPIELCRAMDEYFSNALPPKKHPRAIAEKQEYDKLYDLPKKEFSVSDAARIEEMSWSTTAELIEAFDDDNGCNEADTEIPQVAIFASSENQKSDRADVGDGNVTEAFVAYKDVIDELIKGNSHYLRAKAMELGKLVDGVVDEINEIAYESFGDALIEDDGFGGYKIIDDYKNLFE